MMDYVYCPMCAQALSRKEIFGRERSWCPACGFIHFREPRLAVGALVVEDGRLLLIRRAVVPRIGFWAVPSGFVEHDEAPRQALAREVAEETGLQVEIGRVLEALPNADPDKPGVFLLFQAQPVAGHLAPGDDVSEARWFSREDMPWDDMAFPHMKDVLRRLWDALEVDR